MKFKLIKHIAAAALSVAVAASAVSICSDMQLNSITQVNAADAVSTKLTINDLPSDYKSAADWIWETRIQGEKSVEAWDTIYDKIIAGNGTLNYVVRWQTYKNVSLEQRQNIQKVLEKAINDWTDRLVGYENWPYSHVNVKIVGWAVLDKNCLLDLQPDETVYTDTSAYDPTYDIQNGMGDSRIPTLMPEAPIELFRYEHWRDPDWSYKGSYENRYDMHLTATLGMINMGGYGYYWGQQLSDEAVLGLADGTTSIHILEHEVGHGFGFTDFYGDEGASDGFPPGGFPGGGTSIMMAGSSSVITDFDGWFARYVWTKISQEEGRFNIPGIPEPTEPTEVTDPTEPTETEPTEVTEPTEATYVTVPTEPTETIVTKPGENHGKKDFTDTIISVTDSEITFAENGTFKFSKGYYGSDEEKNLSNYEAGDKIHISFMYDTRNNTILTVSSIELIENVRGDDVLGDVNLDGSFNLSDVIMMQKWLAGLGEIGSLTNANCYSKDNVINVFDLVYMKRMLINGQ